MVKRARKLAKNAVSGLKIRILRQIFYCHEIKEGELGVASRNRSENKNAYKIIFCKALRRYASGQNGSPATRNSTDMN